MGADETGIDMDPRVKPEGDVRSAATGTAGPEAVPVVAGASNPA